MSAENTCCVAELMLGMLLSVYGPFKNGKIAMEWAQKEQDDCKVKDTKFQVFALRKPPKEQ